MTIKIEHDPLFIAQRLKEIDPTYYIVYNIEKHQYEVHSTDQLGSSYCFSVKYPSLDERTIDYARKTRADKADALIKALDKENEKIGLCLARTALEKIQEGLC